MNILSPQHPFASYILVIKNNKVLNRLAEVNLSKGYCWQIRCVGQPFPKERRNTKIYINDLDGLLLTLVRIDFDKVLVPNTLDCIFAETQSYYRDFVRNIVKKPKVSVYDTLMEYIEPAPQVTVTSAGLESEELQGFMGEAVSAREDAEELSQVFNDPVMREWLHLNRHGIDCYEDVILPILADFEDTKEFTTDPVMITPIVTMTKPNHFFRAATEDVVDHKKEVFALQDYVDDGVSSPPWTTRNELDELLESEGSYSLDTATDSED